MTKASILIVDDEKNIRLWLQELLLAEGHTVMTAEDGQTALSLLRQRSFDLILLDLKMPGFDGIQVLKTLRQQSLEVAVIILTAHATLTTAVEALREGAFDYLFKPISPEQLLDSIHRGLQTNQKNKQQQTLIAQLEQVANGLAQLQTPADRTETSSPHERSESSIPLPGSTQERLLKYGPFVIDRIRQVAIADGHLLDLSPTELDLLAYLVQQAPRVVSSPEIIQAIQDYQVDHWEAGNIVRQHIHNLRRKIQTAGGNPDDIHTVRGKGYVLKPE